MSRNFGRREVEEEGADLGRSEEGLLVGGLRALHLRLERRDAREERKDELMLELELRTCCSAASTIFCCNEMREAGASREPGSSGTAGRVHLETRESAPCRRACGVAVKGETERGRKLKEPEMRDHCDLLPC